MAIKLYTIIFGLLLFRCATAQVEEQRKYAIDDFGDIRKFIKESGTINSFLAHHHSEYVYFDIYLETPDFKLLRSGYSLRFRKRTNKNTQEKATYTFQLKSEMISALGHRMEVEEPELDFYQIALDSGRISLTSVIDNIVDEFNPDSIQGDSIKETGMLQTWIRHKSEAPISPFQKLRHLGILTPGEIEKLKPVICAVTTRFRSHVYCDTTKTTTKNLKRNRVKRDELPDYFRANKNYNWLMESSLDESRFYELPPGSELILEIKELELENKYSYAKEGTRLMNQFEMELDEKFDIRTKTDSKYKQAVSKVFYAGHLKNNQHN